MRIVPGIVVEEEKVVPVAPAPVAVKKNNGFYVFNSDNDQSYGYFASEAIANTWISKRQDACDEEGEDQFGVCWNDCEVVAMYTIFSS